MDSWAMTEDRSSCEIRGITPNRDRYTMQSDYSLRRVPNTGIYIYIYIYIYVLYINPGPWNITVIPLIAMML